MNMPTISGLPPSEYDEYALVAVSSQETRLFALELLITLLHEIPKRIVFDAFASVSWGNANGLLKIH